MTHNEKRSSPGREAAISLLTGGLYGATHTMTGHPLDTIKTKMQFGEKGGVLTVARRMLRTEGVLGFFRGCVPPLWGSMVYRGVMMSSYEFAFTYIDKNVGEDSFLKSDAWAVRPMVPVSTVFCSFCRVVVESPVEYAKVMGQSGQRWAYRDVYRGVGWQVARSTFLLMPIFGIMDYCRRRTTIMATYWGNFLVMVGASGGSYLLCWPLETMKNLAQGGIPRHGATFTERIHFLGGYRGLYRGALPGTVAGGLRNGFGMLAMIYAQRLVTQLGLRD